MHTHGHSYTWVLTWPRTHTFIQTLMHTHAHIRIHSCTWTLKDTHSYTLTHTHTLTHMDTQGHIHVDAYAHSRTFIHTGTHTWTRTHTITRLRTLTVWSHSREQRASTGSGSGPLSPSPHSVPVPAARASSPGPSSSPWPSCGVAQPCPGLSMPLHPAGAWRTSSLPLTPVRAPQPPGLPGTRTSVSRLPSSRTARLAGEPGDLPPEPCPASTPVLEPSAARRAWLDSAQLHPSAVWATPGRSPRAPRPAWAARLVAQASLCLQPG